MNLRSSIARARRNEKEVPLYRTSGTLDFLSPIAEEQVEECRGGKTDAKKKEFTRLAC
jgi:hypothetical protein